MLTMIPQHCSPGNRRLVATSDGGFSVREIVGEDGREWFEVCIGGVTFSFAINQRAFKKLIGNNAVFGFQRGVREVDGDTLECWSLRADDEEGNWVELHIPIDSDQAAVLEASSEEVATVRYLSTRMWIKYDPSLARLRILVLLIGLTLLSGAITWLVLR